MPACAAQAVDGADDEAEGRARIARSGLAHGGREAIAEAAVGGHEDDGQIRLVNHDGAEPFEAVCCMAAGGQAVVEGEGSFVPPWAA